MVEQAAEPLRAPDVLEAPAIAPALALARQIGNRAFTRMLQREATAERALDREWTVDTSGYSDEQKKALLKSGKIAMTFWEYYTPVPETSDNPDPAERAKEIKKKKDKNANNTEFERAALDFAKTYGTIGLNNASGGADLKVGIPTKVKSLGDVIQAMNSVRQTLHGFWYGLDHAENNDTRIGTVAIFCHGESFGIGLDPANARYTKKEDLPSFVSAIRGTISDDVKFLLYACLTTAAPGEVVDQTKGDPGGGGVGSFAQSLANALGGEAEVYGHDVAQNVASNPYARRFKAGAAQGESMFELLYGDAFIKGEVERLKKDRAPLVGGMSDADLTKAVKSAAWRHYYDAVAVDFGRVLSNSRHFSMGGYSGVGGAMFMDIEGTKGKLRKDFEDYWLDEATIKNNFERPKK